MGLFSMLHNASMLDNGELCTEFRSPAASWGSVTLKSGHMVTGNHASTHAWQDLEFDLAHYGLHVTTAILSTTMAMADMRDVNAHLCFEVVSQ